MFNKLNKSLRSVLSLPRLAKQAIAIITDTSLCIITLWIALFLRLDNYQFSNLGESLRLASLVSVLVAIPIFWIMGLYRSMFRYSSSNVMASVFLNFGLWTFIFFNNFNFWH